MKMPSFLSQKFVHFGEEEDVKKVSQAIAESGLDNAVEFFIECTDYTSWVKEEGKPLMVLLFEFLSQEWFAFRLKTDVAREVVHAFWKIYPLVENELIQNVEFIVDTENFKESFLPFVALSTAAEEFLHSKKSLKKPIPLRLADVTQYKLMREYIYTGEVEFLWREEPEAIIELLKRASDVGMPGLAEFAAETYKRYLNEENVVETLERANREYLKPLEEACCRYISDHALGIDIQRSEYFGIRLEVDYIRDRFHPVLERIAKDVTHLKIKGTVGTDAFLVELLPKMRKLVQIDISESRPVSYDFIDEFPVVSEWVLSGIDWIDDEIFDRLISRGKKVSRLEAASLGSLTEKSWAGLSRFPWLTTLDISDTFEIGNDLIELIARAAPMLTEVIFRHPQIGDQGLIALGESCAELRVLDLTGCSLTNEGIIAFSEKAQNLQRWVLKDGRGFDEEGLDMAFRQLPQLEKVDLTGCRVSTHFQEIWKEKIEL